MKAEEVIKELKKIGNPEKAKASAVFFKTGEGQYGHGDVFLGVTTPERRIISKKFQTLSLAEIKKLLDHEYHECRSVALDILDRQYALATKTKDSGGAVTQKEIVDFYRKNLSRVNNWDLVDSSAHQILGQYILQNEFRDAEWLYKYAESKDLWEKRVAIVTTYAFIKKREYSHTLRISKILLNDTHDLIHKAVGWMLREVGKMNESVLLEFLDQNASKMPRTTLRYAIERLPESLRKKYMAVKKA